MKIKIFIVGVFLFVIPAYSFAINVSGYNLPTHITLNGAKLSLNGYGIRRATFFGIKVYIAALYTQKPIRNFKDAIENKQEQVIFMHFVHKVMLNEFLKAFKSDFEKSSPLNIAKSQCVNEFLSIFKHNIENHENIYIILTPKYKSVYVRINNKIVGEVKSKSLIVAIERLVIGPNPADQRLKNELLGKMHLQIAN